MPPSAPSGNQVMPQFAKPHPRTPSSQVRKAEHAAIHHHNTESRRRTCRPVICSHPATRSACRSRGHSVRLDLSTAGKPIQSTTSEVALVITESTPHHPKAVAENSNQYVCSIPIRMQILRANGKEDISTEGKPKHCTSQNWPVSPELICQISPTGSSKPNPKMDCNAGVSRSPVR